MADVFLSCQCLTKDMATGLYQTLNGLVELTKHQLSTTHEFVALNNYSQDPVEEAPEVFDKC